MQTPWHDEDRPSSLSREERQRVVDLWDKRDMNWRKRNALTDAERAELAALERRMR